MWIVSCIEAYLFGSSSRQKNILILIAQRVRLIKMLQKQKHSNGCQELIVKWRCICLYILHQLFAPRFHLSLSNTGQGETVDNYSHLRFRSIPWSRWVLVGRAQRSPLSMEIVATSLFGPWGQRMPKPLLLHTTRAMSSCKKSM